MAHETKLTFSGTDTETNEDVWEGGAGCVDLTSDANTVTFQVKLNGSDWRTVVDVLGNNVTVSATGAYFTVTLPDNVPIRANRNTNGTETVAVKYIRAAISQDT